MLIIEEHVAGEGRIRVAVDLRVELLDRFVRGNDGNLIAWLTVENAVDRARRPAPSDRLILNDNHRFYPEGVHTLAILRQVNNGLGKKKHPKRKDAECSAADLGSRNRKGDIKLVETRLGHGEDACCFGEIIGHVRNVERIGERPRSKYGVLVVGDKQPLQFGVEGGCSLAKSIAT